LLLRSPTQALEVGGLLGSRHPVAATHDYRVLVASLVLEASQTHRLTNQIQIQEHNMRFTLRYLVVSTLILALAGAAWGQPLPSAPNPQHIVEHDPGAWAITTALTSTGVGIWKPWVGLTAGLVVAIAPNLQDSRNAHQNLVGGVAGAFAGYVIIKTLKHDWHGKKLVQRRRNG
jgi:hypothetical protein